MATQSLNCDEWKKNVSVDSVCRTYKLCYYSNMLKCGRSIFACRENKLTIHSKNPLKVSSLTTGNKGQLKMSPNFHPSQKRRFWIWPKTSTFQKDFNLYS